MAECPPEFGRSLVLIHLGPCHTKDFKNGTTPLCDTPRKKDKKVGYGISDGCTVHFSLCEPLTSPWGLISLVLVNLNTPFLNSGLYILQGILIFLKVPIIRKEERVRNNQTVSFFRQGDFYI